MTHKYRYVLGVQCFANQDSGAAIVRFTDDGKALDFVAISEERLIRQKYPYTFPMHSISYCMEHFGINSLSEIDLLVSDFIRREQWFRSGPAYNCGEFDYLKLKFDFDPRRIIQISHHMAHAASAFHASEFDQAAVLIIDGNGSDLETTSFLTATKEEIRYIDTYRARGPGALYSAVTKRILGLGTGGEGKTMGLAPYGASYPRALDIEDKFDGIRTDYSEFMRRMPYSDVLNQIDARNTIDPLLGSYPQCSEKHRVMEPFYARAAFDVQEATERAMVHLGKELYARTGTKNLCVAGGVALNSVANKIMFDASGFENIFVFPACSDAGIPFGLAIWGYYHASELGAFPRKKLAFRNAYTGTEYTQAAIDATLGKYGIPSTVVGPRDVAQLIADGKIIGWFQGKSEYGPRALGHRSILADSRRAEMTSIVNDRVKHREPYRPFAPAVLAEYCAEYFDIEGESPFMLLVANVKKPTVVPAITHVDNTARVQTVTQANNGIFYDLIVAFREITGVPVILNTSFNDAGEPIVETPADALICFLSTEMDGLVLGNRLVRADPKLRAIAKTMAEDRTAALAAQEAHLRSQMFPNYDEDERDAYIKEENLQAQWHVLWHAKFELERKVESWCKSRRRILIVGTAEHTACLLDHIAGFYNLDVVGLIKTRDHEYGERKEKFVLPYQALDWSQLREADYDEILVSSHEYSYELLDRISSEYPSAVTFAIYDNSARSLIESFRRFPKIARVRPVQPSSKTFSPKEESLVASKRPHGSFVRSS